MERFICRCFMSYFIGYKIGNEVFRYKYPASIYYKPPPLLSWSLKS